MDFATFVNSLDLISLQNLEEKLLKQVEINSSDQSRQCEKHQQFALNAAHFLRLYNTSTSDILSDLATFQINSGETVLKIEEDSSRVPAERINQIISENGLRFLWDSLYQKDFHRSTLMLSYYLMNENVRIINSYDSLKYFQDTLVKTVLEYLSNPDPIDDNDIKDLFLPLIIFGSGHISEYYFQVYGYGNDTDIKIKTCLFRLKVITNRFQEQKQKVKGLTDGFLDSEEECIFAERLNGNYCEFSELCDFKYKLNINLEDQLNILENGFNEILELYCQIILKNVTSFTKSDLIDLAEIPSQSEKCNLLREEIHLKLNEITTEKFSITLKAELMSLIDRILKAIQSSMRFDSVNINNSSYAQHLTRNLIAQTVSIFNIMNNNNNNDDDYNNNNNNNNLLIEIFTGFRQNIKNKTNIILTIQGNEMVSIDKKREFQFPIGPRSYLTIHLFTELEKGCLCLIQEVVSHQTGGLNKSKSKSIQQTQQTLLLHLIKTEIFEPFFTNWNEIVKKTFITIKNETDELSALFWLSDLMIRADLGYNQSQSQNHQILFTDLEINETEIAQKYPGQQLFFAGLFKDDINAKHPLNPNPQLLHSTTNPNPNQSRSIDLLPHFSLNTNT